jgi:hypothetical protein
MRKNDSRPIQERQKTLLSVNRKGREEQTGAAELSSAGGVLSRLCFVVDAIRRSLKTPQCIMKERPATGEGHRLRCATLCRASLRYGGA